MSDFVRLLDGDADSVERELLQSAALDAPTLEVRQRTLLALGVTSGVVATGAAGWAGSGGATSGTSAAAGGKAAGWLGLGGLAKWFGGGIAGGLLFAGAAAAMSEPETAPRAVGRALPTEATEAPAAPPVVNAAASPPAEAVAASQPAPKAATPTGPVAARTAPVPRAAKAPAAEPAVMPAPSATSVLDEVALLDAARNALQAGDLAKASSALGEHQQRYRGGALAPEATLLRIRMLLSTGRRDEATSLAEGFLRRHPKSPHGRRIRSLLEVP